MGASKLRFGILLTSVAFFFVACGSSGNGDSNGGDGAAASGGTGAEASTTGGAGGQGGGAASGTGGGAASGTGGGAASTGSDAGLLDVTFGYDADPEDAALSPDATCAASAIKAEPLPLDMYIILDKSGSMGTDCNVGSNGTSKWCYAINALNKFFTAPSSVGTGVALSFFSGSSCPNLANAQVAYNTLPNHVTQLNNAMNGASPGGNTPTSAAANGIASYTAANEKPGRKMIGVLITDGDPTSCSPTNVGQINTILANHFGSTNIPTFIIGMTGASFTNLETLANNAGAPSHTQNCGGGVNPCHFYNVANGDPAVFLAVLKAIQQTAIGCQYTIPTTDAGVIDPDKVVVEYTPGSGGPPQPLARVNDASQCTASGGWHYDNNANPKLIVLCPATCSAVTADQKAGIQIALGCLGS